MADNATEMTTIGDGNELNEDSNAVAMQTNDAATSIPATAATNIPPSLTALHEVDLTAPDMDPFEWTARKLIPIPKEYYWDNPDVTEEELPTRLKLWHRTVGTLESIVQFTDNTVGKKVADLTGLSSQRFDYVTSSMTEADWEYSRQVVAQRLARQNDEAQNHVDHGATTATAQEEEEAVSVKVDLNLGGDDVAVDEEASAQV
mmetsp:Transcript_22924/g.63896  ORF Transcript_22924/g.63896 Transcript_22924/m.63896 type:complete len:203 (-) Transcript_22924:327-935(-)